MNTQWLIVMSIVVVFALAGVMGALYINSIHVLSDGAVTIVESAPPMGAADRLGILAVTTRGTAPSLSIPTRRPTRRARKSGFRPFRWKDTSSSVGRARSNPIRTSSP